MAKSKRPGPRRRPKRRDSKETVEVIVEAARQLFLSSGVPNTTTNAIAKRAGVSVGSLYQYFSNKEAIVRELAERQWRVGLERVVEARDAGGDLETVVRNFVETIATSEAGDPALRRALLLEVPLSWVQDTAKPVTRAVEDAVASRLAELRKRGPRSDADEARIRVEAFVLAHAVRGVVESALVEDPKLLEDDTLHEVLTAMIIRYVRGSSTAPPRVRADCE